MRQDMPGGQARVRPRSSVLAAPQRPERAFERTFAPGTLLETDSGWHPIERLRAGMLVHTLEGMVPISGLSRQPADRSHVHWQIPAGNLGNCSDTRLTAGQHVAVTDPTCHSLFGAPLVLLPVPTTTGFCGVRTVTGFSLRGGIALRFETEQIVFAQTGMLLHVPGPTGPSRHRTLNYREARRLLALLCETRRDGRKDTSPIPLRPIRGRVRGDLHQVTSARNM